MESADNNTELCAIILMSADN